MTRRTKRARRKAPGLAAPGLAATAGAVHEAQVVTLEMPLPSLAQPISSTSVKPVIAEYAPPQPTTSSAAGSAM